MYWQVVDDIEKYIMSLPEGVSYEGDDTIEISVNAGMYCKHRNAKNLVYKNAQYEDYAHSVLVGVLTTIVFFLISNFCGIGFKWWMPVAALVIAFYYFCERVKIQRNAHKEEDENADPASFGDPIEYTEYKCKSPHFFNPDGSANDEWEQERVEVQNWRVVKYIYESIKARGAVCTLNSYLIVIAITSLITALVVAGLCSNR